MNIELIAVFTENGVILDTEETKNKTFYNNDKLLAEFKADPYNALLHFGFDPKSLEMSQSMAYLHGICSFFIEKLSKNPDLEIERAAAPLTLEETDALTQKIPYTIGAEYVDAAWMRTMWDRLAKAFEDDLARFGGAASQYLLTYNSSINVAGRVFFHLVENKSDASPFAFLATYSRETADPGKAEHVPLKNALLEFKDDQSKLLQLLSTVSRAADKSEFISELVESGELFSPLRFTAQEAYTFLKEIPLYEQCGIMCRMPDWWKKKYNTFKVNVSIGDKMPSRVGLDALLSFDAGLSLGDESITREELEELLSQTAGLSFLKGKWVEIDHQKLREVLDIYDKASKSMRNMTLGEALRWQMGLGGGIDAQSGDIAEVSNGEWLSNVLNNLRMPDRLAKLSAGDEFNATLRRYQQSGFDWLATMKISGFGALLADDMGLGKTIQVLALLEYLRKNEGVKTLLIIPTSLIGNWRTEIERFAPKLRYSILHNKTKDIEWNEADLFITTYGMSLRIEELKTYEWDLLILDEAQAIKNPGTKQTKTIKTIPAKFHVAMTGTPVENRMSDLWSIFDFLNAGLLGTSKEFSDYAKSIQSNESYAKLRKTIQPFILRRLKTDKSIISDLPDKVEMKTYSTLTKKQAALYTALVAELENRLITLEGIERKGVVLASLMKFKQICNHPDQYLGQDVFDCTHSGKYQVLSEICETIYDKRERVLVFTQFREMCEPLSAWLNTLFQKKGLVLHGGTPVKKRAELVEQFNSDEYVPYMILSLKAGGVGLNLTSANHVIHFDRWWNPAVENQATDRAFRIGQKKNVIVHKFITKGTVEEKIDLMIEDKLKLSGELIASSGENWITEMTSRELINLFTLSI